MSTETIPCRICNEGVHHVERHLQEAHPNIGIEEYQKSYPGTPLTSPKYDAMQEKLRRDNVAKRQEEERAAAMIAKVIPFSAPGSVVKQPMNEVFGMPLSDDLRAPARRGQTQGDAIRVDVLDGLSKQEEEAVPDVDDGYVFRIDELKDCVMAVQLNMPLLVWGMHGAGKTSLIEQICARTNRPWIRVQHTDTTEEAHIIGQMLVRNGGTEFEYGPLAEAMMKGWVYVADEYDFAHPAVIAVYQPVLEGKPLYIKEAPAGQRLVKPHANFRFVATGNTNGSGDDTGLYSGTKIGNAAAYSRFGVTVQAHYPETATEVAILKQRVGINTDMAEKLVEFAGRVRTMCQSGELSLPISPRELIRSATIAMVKGGAFRKGLELAYINRLDATQGEAVRQTAQRIFS